MGGLTDSEPKSFVKLGGRRLLDWQISALRDGGVEHVAVVRGYRGEAFDAYRPNIHLFDNPLWDRTNMVESLVCARQWLESYDCIVSYSDIVYPSSFIDALSRCNPRDLAIAYDPNWLALWSQRFEDPLSDAESFELAADSTLKDIGRRVSSASLIQGQYMGLLRFSPHSWVTVWRYLDCLPGTERLAMDMTSLLSRLLAAGVRVTALPVLGPWGEVDSASDLHLYESVGLARRLES